ncbi:MAG: hypothetical protein R2942_01575 [Ignavibacteria bacterium]
MQYTVNINISNNTIISSNGGTTVGASLGVLILTDSFSTRQVLSLL